MNPDFVDVVVRWHGDEALSEVEEVLAIRLLPTSNDLDPAAVTESVRRWLVQEGHQVFQLQEHRSYTVAGAAGSGVTFIIDLLAAGAVGVAMQELVSFIKGRIGDHVEEIHSEAPPEVRQRREGPLEEATRLLGVGRGDLVVNTVDREGTETHMVVKSLSSGDAYEVTMHAHETIRHIRRLG